MKNIAVFISGRGSNFIAIDKNIRSGLLKDCKIVLVFSNNINAEGLKYAKEVGIETKVIVSEKNESRIDYDKKIVEAIKPYNIDLICLAGYMKIITSEIINQYRDKIINIHPSLLPSFPGLHAQKQALDYGVKISGCTVHFVDEGVDSGKIILQKSVPVYDNDTEDSLSARILEQEHIAYTQAIKMVLSGVLWS